MIFKADKKPEILNKNQTIIARKGERVVLLCNATGIPFPNITWVKESACSGFGRNVQPLVISNVTQNEAGTYKCIATNHLGRDETHIKLVVNGNPSFVF